MKRNLHHVGIIVILLIVFTLIIFDYLTHTYIKAEFIKSDPMPEKMGVYYKGYKIGSTSKLRISKDFRTTYLYITLNQRGLHLPKNISAEVKDYNDNIKFVDIIYPSAPMIKYVKTGDTIKGTYHLSQDGISATNQAHLDNLSAKGERLLSAATETAENLTDLFNLIFDMLDENRTNLHSSTTALNNSMQNLEATTQNLKELSNKINNELTQEIIKNSAQNIELTTKNIASSSKSLPSISDKFYKTGTDFSLLPSKLNTLVDTAQILMCNLNDITSGIKATLKQRFSGMRIFFGKTLK